MLCHYREECTRIFRLGVAPAIRYRSLVGQCSTSSNGSALDACNTTSEEVCAIVSCRVCVIEEYRMLEPRVVSDIAREWGSAELGSCT